jgi:uncharacterized membrane protein YqaE (UPF0057 family)
MKKLLTPIILFTIAGLVLSSCSNSSKLSFSKRHYRSGYFVDINKSTHTILPSFVKPAKETNHSLSIQVISKPGNNIKAIISVPAKEKPDIILNTPISNKVSVSSPSITYTNNEALSTSTLNTWGSNDVAGSAGDSPRDRNSISVPFVVVVICAILIPPLGVGLMYGIHSYFWIDLLLTLLFFFPGMIFALVVVLM